jgi:hypothetical protein
VVTDEPNQLYPEYTDEDMPGMAARADFEYGETDTARDRKQLDPEAVEWEAAVEVDEGTCSECGEALEDPDSCEHCGWNNGEEDSA